MKLDMVKTEHIISNALAEDIGDGDLTSNLTIPENTESAFTFRTREDMIVCGLPILEMIFDKISCQAHVNEGDYVTTGTNIFSISGNARNILARERVALNLIQRMCAIASITRKFVDKIKDSQAKILDTRKTTPGLREIEKYAVFIGGGTNHRMRLDDGILIKDNHISSAGSITAAVTAAKQGKTQDKTIEVECDTIEQVREAISAGAEMLLLDNMSTDTLRQIVSETAGKIPLEASGGVTIDTVADIAATGVNYISVGALTHSAQCVDIGLDEESFETE